MTSTSPNLTRYDLNKHTDDAYAKYPFGYSSEITGNVPVSWEMLGDAVKVLLKYRDAGVLGFEDIEKIAQHHKIDAPILGFALWMLRQNGWMD